MCGILGFVGAPPSLESGQRAIRSLRHRGPDGEGSWQSVGREALFFHRRLSILDLSSTGDQPMVDPVTGTAIVFNGEIYNHRSLRKQLTRDGYQFRGRSDTEVILLGYRRWGGGVIERLVGAFAVGLFDGQTRELLLARDRAGEKPLFYTARKDGIGFASETKALLPFQSQGATVSRDALNCYLTLGYVPGGMCLLSGFAKLPPAHTLRYRPSDSSIRVDRYWSPPALNPTGRSSEDLLEELSDRLHSAVSGQLEADVPVGLLLSGGVDSSLIAAVLSNLGKDVRAFTVSFPGSSEHDEASHAARIASAFGLAHTVIPTTAPSPEMVGRLAFHFDEPIADSSMIPTSRLAEVVSQHCKVVLGGDGGDELFGGYATYNRLLALRAGSSVAPIRLRRQLSRLLVERLPLEAKGRGLAGQIGTDFSRSLPLASTYFDSTTRARLLKEGPPPFDGVEAIWATRTPTGADLLDRATRMDFTNYLPDDVLVKVDRASMMHSLEVRAPFLDHRIAEFAFSSVPSHLKATMRQRKILPKQLAHRILPKGFDYRRKQGFRAPLGQWLADDASWRDFFSSALLDNRDSPFDRKYVEALLLNPQATGGLTQRLFCLVMFELWRTEFRVTV